MTTDEAAKIIHYATCMIGQKAIAEKACELLKKPAYEVLALQAKASAKMQALYDGFYNMVKADDKHGMFSHWMSGILMKYAEENNIVEGGIYKTDAERDAFKAFAEEELTRILKIVRRDKIADEEKKAEALIATPAEA